MGLIYSSFVLEPINHGKEAYMLFTELKIENWKRGGWSQNTFLNKDSC